MEIKFSHILDFGTSGVEQLASHSYLFTARERVLTTHYKEVLADPRVDLNVVEEWNIPASAGIQTIASHFLTELFEIF